MCVSQLAAEKTLLQEHEKALLAREKDTDRRAHVELLGWQREKEKKISDLEIALEQASRHSYV